MVLKIETPDLSKSDPTLCSSHRRSFPGFLGSPGEGSASPAVHPAAPWALPPAPLPHWVEPACIFVAKQCLARPVPLSECPRGKRAASRATNDGGENKSNWEEAKGRCRTTGRTFGLTERACLIGEPQRVAVIGKPVNQWEGSEGELAVRRGHKVLSLSSPAL